MKKLMVWLFAEKRYVSIDDVDSEGGSVIYTPTATVIEMTDKDFLYDLLDFLQGKKVLSCKDMEGKEEVARFKWEG